MLEIESVLNLPIKDTCYASEAFYGESENVRQVLKDAGPGLLERVLSREDFYESRFMLGFLLSAIPWDQLTPRIRQELLVTYSEDQATIKPFHAYWGLCESSEGKLIDSIVVRSAMLVNDFLLVKGIGYTTGLALRTVSTTQGTFFQGGWYSPINETKRSLNEQLDRGTESLNIGRSEWAYMRDITRYISPEAARNVIGRAQAYTPITS